MGPISRETHRSQNPQNLTRTRWELIQLTWTQSTLWADVHICLQALLRGTEMVKDEKFIYSLLIDALNQTFEINPALWHMPFLLCCPAHFKHIFNVQTLVCAVEVQEQRFLNNEVPRILQVNLKFDRMKRLFEVYLHVSIANELDQHKIVLVNKNMSDVHFLVKPCIAENYFKIFQFNILVRLPSVDFSFARPGWS